MDIRKKFGFKVKSFKVKSLRVNKGWSQEKLSFEASLDRTYIPSIESGKRNVSILVIEKLAIAFDVPIDELFN
jgi:transcriptional regulator with XRE-family HTH domain